MSDVKILLAASLKMRVEGRMGAWRRGTSEEGRNGGGLHEGSSKGVEGNGQPGELFQCTTISLGCRAEGESREVVQVCGLGARGERGGFPSGGGTVNRDIFVLSGLWDSVFWTQGVLRG